MDERATDRQCSRKMETRQIELKTLFEETSLWIKMIIPLKGL